MQEAILHKKEGRIELSKSFDFMCPSFLFSIASYMIYSSDARSSHSSTTNLRYKFPSSYSSSGGFEAEYDDGNLYLRFVVEEWDERASDE